MGASASDGWAASEKARLTAAAEKLGLALAEAECILVTGATTGLPHLVAQTFRRAGAFALGVSPAINRDEHLQRYGLPEDGADVIVYTGFGLKGRNVINIRSSEIVIIFGGGMGTLNEFTIAYDEGKVIGVLEDTGGIADHIREIISFCNKHTSSVIVYDDDPRNLVRKCLERWKAKQ